MEPIFTCHLTAADRAALATQFPAATTFLNAALQRGELARLQRLQQWGMLTGEERERLLALQHQAPTPASITHDHLAVRLGS